MLSMNVQANDLKSADAYLEKGDYKIAYDIYKNIEMTGQANAEMYKNMAMIMNTEGKLGWTVLYLEKALKLDPKDDKTIRLLENIKSDAGIPKELKSANLSAKLLEIFLGIAKGTWWSMSLATVLFLGYFVWTKSPYFKLSQKDYYIIGLVSFFVVFMTIMGFINHHFLTNTYIIVQDTPLNLSPDFDSSASIELTEGSKVKLVSTLDNWIKVKDFYGDEGWILLDKASKI